jgi:hypothetical protein
MGFLVTPRRRLGVALSKQEVSKAIPVKADVHITERHDEGLGRSTTMAYLFSASRHQTVPLPDLLDAKITGMAQNGININITGIEEVDGAYYFQSWWCRLEWRSSGRVEAADRESAGPGHRSGRASENAGGPGDAGAPAPAGWTG